MALRLGSSDRAEASSLLTEHGFPSDPEAIERVGRALFDAKVLAAKLLRRRAEGDWRPGSDGSRFPPATDATPVAPAPSTIKDGCTMDELFAGWAADQGYAMDIKPMPRALYDRKRTMERLPSFLGHRDAGVVSKTEAVRWKEDMQKRGLHASTVRNDIGELRVIWRWGSRHGKLTGDNPWNDVSPPKAKRRARAVRAFTDAEAASILEAARRESGSLRWPAWLLCLTDARVSEVAQMTREDVALVEGVHVLRITDEGEEDEARSVKTAAS